MQVSQTAYHGTPLDFEKFKLDMIGTGQELQTFGYGCYFTACPSVAESYKDDTSISSNKPVVHYSFPSNDYKDPISSNDRLARAAKLIEENGYDVAIAISEDEDEDEFYPELSSELEEFEDEEICRHEGLIYEVKIPNSERLIDLDDSYTSLISNITILNSLLGADKVNDIEEYFIACFNPESNIEEFKDLFEKIIIEDHSPSLMDEIEIHFPDLDLSKAMKMLGPHHLGVCEDFTGGNLIAHMNHLLGSPEATSLKLKELGIPGAKTKSSMFSDNKNETFIIWDESEIKVIEKHIDTPVIDNAYSFEDNYYNY